nr:MAG TPA: hypothetical protein [Caudoviricetes sp.]
MSYLELSLENHYHLPLPAHRLLAHQTVPAMFPCYPKHLYLYYFAKLLEIFLAL